MLYNNNTIEDILRRIAEEDYNFVEFFFTDSLGKLHHTSYRSSAIKQYELEHGISFDGSSIAGWQQINQSDMILRPDLATAFSNPFTSHSTLTMFCDVINPATGANYHKDPRAIARKAAEYAKKQQVGDQIYFGPELEFFIFDDVKFWNHPHNAGFVLDAEEASHNSSRDYSSGNGGHRPGVKGGYFPVPPIDSLNDIRAEMSMMAESVGLKPHVHHHEVAEGQCEVGFEYDSIVPSGDNVQKFKFIARNVAASYGKSATFMPKPIFGDNGSGMHTHQSIWKGGANLFYQEGMREELSELCLYYIGGIIKHAKVINAFANPSTNSYKRLVPGFEAPVKLAYSARNRSAAIRIPYSQGKNAKRIEVRFPDPSCNPYLSFAAMLMAGLDGIKNHIHPGEAMDENLYELEKKQADSIPSVAASLREALEHLGQNRSFLTEGEVFTDDFINSYIQLKLPEIEELETRPHPVEFKLYYSC